MGARFVAGLDGGGSKTAVCCLGREGQVLSQAVFGQLNINSSDRALVLATLKDLAAHLLSLSRDGASCAGLTIAAAGVSHPEAKAFIQEGLRLGGLEVPFDLIGDQEAALRGAVGKVGAVLVAGTGSICIGRNDAGRTARAGGWGYLLDDEGGGYALGREILRAALRARDGRGPQTLLTDLLLKEHGLKEPRDIIRYAYDPVESKNNIANLAGLLRPALQEEDGAALGIIRRAADELLGLARAVITPLGLQTADLALTGGILTHHPRIRALVVERLEEAFPGLRVIAPRQDAARGAAELARETYLA